MKPWEIEKTKSKLKKLSPKKGIKLFFDLYYAGLQILKDSLINENPRLIKNQLKQKINALAKSLGSL